MPDTIQQNPNAQGVRPSALSVAPAAIPSSGPSALTAPRGSSPSPTPPDAPTTRSPANRRRTWLVRAGVVLAAGIVACFVAPRVKTALNTVSTDDAYVNGHVTFVAPRVVGQVAKVLVDDNFRVKKGDLLVQLDREPFEVQVAIKQAAVAEAQAQLVAANALVRGQVAATQADRFALQHAIEMFDTQVANLHAAVATLNSSKATLELSKSNLKRGEELAPTGGISKEDLDERRQKVSVDEAAVEQALQSVYAIRVGLGLPAQPAAGEALTSVPPDLAQRFSTVREALGTVLQNAAEFGYFPTTWDATPREALREFYQQDPDGNVDRILNRLIPEAPTIKLAEAEVLKAQRDLDEAELNLRYCDIVSEIDGIVTRRDVNPGNNVEVGQSLMAVRSLNETWIDANFKETQLRELRIGQRVRCVVDMYGDRREFEGRITGFTMGTGQTLALLPPQNATGNFVKIVQRLPVRIELTDYNPDQAPLFVGLSVTPYVYIKEPPSGPDAGAFLQQPAPVPTRPTDPVP